LDTPALGEMALLGLVAKNVTGSLAQSIGNSFMLSKDDTKQVAGFIRANTKKYWKPIAAIGALGVLAYGAHKVRTEIFNQREEAKVRPTVSEAENLSTLVALVEPGVKFNSGEFDELDFLVDELLDEWNIEPELEDCLENDPAASGEVRWSKAETELQILELQIECRDFETSKEADERVAEIKRKKCIIAEEAYLKEQYKRQRKRVRFDKLSQAVKGLAAKIRASFPLPDGSQLQQKAMCLYAAKECRKMFIRETQIAQLVPKAVSLASIPTNAQVDLRVLTKIEPVQLKYNKMAWSGYKNKAGWLSRLVASLD
jgi:hypothetical protein